jgi:Co/Zn/Cd efflux system component
MSWQWTWIDPAVGLIGSVVIMAWAYSLIRDSGSVLLDVAADLGVEKAIRERLEQNGDRITDLHLWQIGPGHRAAVVSIVSDRPQTPAVYKRRLADVPRLSHVTVEVQPCPG